MAPDFVYLLRARSDAICAQWETLLRVEPVSGPLANPDSLVHLISDSLEKFFAALAKPTRASLSLAEAKACVPNCKCGNNPYLAYFVAGEQALVEAAILLQAELPPAERHPNDLSAVMLAVRRLARSEIDTFCGVCDHRTVAPQCRHAESTV